MLFKSFISAIALVTFSAASLICCTAIADSIPDNEPMYGGRHLSDVPVNKDFSRKAAELGWHYLDVGDDETAIKRFNQAWMFDPDNAQVYWGFGDVLGRRSTNAKGKDAEQDLKDSIHFIEIARNKGLQNVAIIADEGYSYTALGYWYSRAKNPLDKENYKKAEELFESAEKINPRYPILYSAWSDLYRFEGDKIHSTQMMDKAKALGYGSAPPAQ